MTTWREIPGWCEFEWLYRSQVEGAKPGSVFVEIGTWVGRSTCMMGELIRDSGKRIDFHAIDHGEGSPELVAELDELVRQGDTIHARLARNLQACGVAEYVQVHIGDSAQLAGLLENHTVDFCFIDGNHTEQAVTRDLAAWLPKMRPGACIAGHDWPLPDVRRAVRHFFEPLVIEDCWVHYLGRP